MTPFYRLFGLSPHSHPFSFLDLTNTLQVQTHRFHSCPRHRGKSPLLPVLYGWFLEGDPILFPLPLRLAGWLARAQRGVCWRWTEAGPVCSGADKLRARCGAAAGEERR